MKLKRIEIHNIASIENATIDFDNGPLKDEPIFLICGETGAGKSTILDAICLALYNSTPRTKNSNNEKVEDKSIANNKSIANTDTRQLMRRNTAEAYAFIDFTGSNGKEYTAKWQVRRAHNRIDGNIQDTVWELIDKSNNHSFNKKNDIENEIGKCIGLTFEQFCRTTILAQGEFTRFMQSAEKDKSEILEKLTGTDIYSTIGQKIYNKKQEKESDLKSKKEALKNISLLEEEEKIRITQEINDKTEEINKKNQEMTAYEVKRKWLEEYEKLNKTIKDNEQKVKELENKTQSDVFLEEAAFVSEWNDTAEVRLKIAQLTSADKEKTALENQETELHDELSRLAGNKKWLENEIKRQGQELEETNKYLKEENSHKEMYDNTQTIVAHLKSSINEITQKERLTRETEKLKKEVSEKEKEINQIKADITQLAKEKEEKENEIVEKNKIAEQYNQTELAERQENIRKEINDIKIAIVKLEQSNNLKQQIDKDLSYIEQYQNNIKETGNRQTELKKQVNELGQKGNELKVLYNKTKDSVDDYAKELRAKLNIGDNCPVCGQEIKSIFSDEHFQSILTPIQNELESVSQQYKDKEIELRTADGTIKTLKNSLKEKEESIKSLQEQLEKIMQETSSLLNNMGADAADENIINILSNIKSNKETELDNVSKTLKTVLELNKQIQSLQSEKDKLNKKENIAKDNANILNNALQKTISNIDANIKQCEKHLESAKAEFEEASSLISWKDWKEEWNRDNNSFIVRLQSSSNLFAEKTKKSESLRNSMEIRQASLNNADNTYNMIIKTSMFTIDENDINISENSKLEEALNIFYGKIQNWKTLLDTKIKSIQEYKEEIRKFITTNPNISKERLVALTRTEKEKINEIENRHNNIKENIISAKTLLGHDIESIRKHQESKPNFEDNEDIETLTSKYNTTKQQTDILNQEIGKNKTILENDIENRKKHNDKIKEIEKLNNELNKWDKLCKIFGDAAGSKFRNIAQSYVLRELLNNANHYLRQLTQRYILEPVPGKLIIMMRDEYQGGVMRPTTTLSGGESFLVSLSLALGLSSLSNRSLSIDTMFIDEGFGTLSGNYLNDVMETLEKLHQIGGKKVGIISHVEGLRERIKTQIQVKRTDNSKSRIDVVQIY